MRLKISSANVVLVAKLSLWLAFPSRFPDRTTILTENPRSLLTSTHIDSMVERNPASTTKGFQPRLGL